MENMVHIAYRLFDNESSSYNPDFPQPFLSGYTPLANLTTRDKVNSSKTEFYGHINQVLRLAK